MRRIIVVYMVLQCSTSTPAAPSWAWGVESTLESMSLSLIEILNREFQSETQFSKSKFVEKYTVELSKRDTKFS